MRLLYNFIYLYLLLRPYYFFGSGGLQISDIFLLLGFVSFLLIFRKDKSVIKKCVGENKSFLLFLAFVWMINIIYYFILGGKQFITSSLHYTFNSFVIIIFSYLLNDNKFLSNMNKIIKINIFVQLIVLIVGMGRYYMKTRYMGTFNDPNQFAYFILISFCYLYLFKEKFNNKLGIYLILSLFLIALSQSTGMLLGISVFIILEIFNVLREFAKFIKKNITKILFSTLIFLTLVSVFLIFNTSNQMHEINIKNYLTNLPIFHRLEQKINDVDKEDGNLLQDRGYDRFYYYPMYIFFGAGQGGDNRWTLAYHQGELHATFPSVLFCYGIIPLFILLRWIYSKLKNVPFKYLIVYVALFIESFTLLNQRQALFWIIILLGNTLKEQVNDNEKDTICSRY